MINTTRIEIIKVSEGERIVSAEVLDDGTCKLTIEEKELFELVEASALSLQDEFMKHEPKTYKEKKFKQFLADAIKRGLNDFYRPRLDPSFDENGEICYMPGEEPAVGKSYNWWQEKAKAFCSERGSRLGTKTEYVAFLGVLLKRLVDSGWKVQDAWSTVCNDSKELGHYWNSKNAKYDFDPTGSREICRFFDLANTFKILAEDEEAGGFWLVGGGYNEDGIDCPLAGLVHFDNRNSDYDYSVGWLVLEK